MFSWLWGMILFLCIGGMPSALRAQVIPVQNSTVLQGLKFWWVVTPQYRGGSVWPNSGSARGTATVTNMASGSGWGSSIRPGSAGAMIFDGTNDYITASQNAGLTPTAPFTMCAWILPTTSGSLNNAFFGTQSQDGADSYNGAALNLDFLTPKFFVYEHPSAKLGIASTSGIVQGKWSHVCGTYDGSQAIAGLTLWVNGRQTSTTTTDNFGTPTSFTDRPLRIGADGAATPSNFFAGGMDDVRLYTRVLPANEILQLAQVGFSPSFASQRPSAVPFPSAAVSSVGSRKVRIQH